MTDYLSDTDSEPYGFTYMKEQIQKQFSDKIIITEIDGRTNVVTMWSTAASILQDFHSHSKKESSQVEKIRIIQTAVKLIKNDIKSLINQKDVYPKYKEMSSVEEACSFLPDLLYIFHQGLFTSVDAKMKIATIGQTILQAARPCVISAPFS